jgi:hypothetical protein
MNKKEKEKEVMNCEVEYIPDFIKKNDKKFFYEKFLKEFGFKRRLVGEIHPYMLNRATSVFGDEDIESIPNIWGNDVKLKKWTKELLEIKEQIEKITKFEYNICLANYYENGKRSIGFHSDKEEIGSNDYISSISLGAERKFVFRDKNDKNKTFEYVLGDGSLFVMGKNCQENYEHSILPDEEVKKGRINLTFRHFDKKRYSKKLVE